MPKQYTTMPENQAHFKEDVAISKAFRENILADLPQDLREPSYFSFLPESSPEVYEYRKQVLGIQTGSQEALSWLRYGIWPLRVFMAAKSISGLLNHYMRQSDMPLNTTIVVSDTTVVNGRNLSKALVEEIERRAECESAAIAGALFAWLIEAAKHKPWIFAGFRAQPVDNGLELVWTPEASSETYRNWGLVYPL